MMVCMTTNMTTERAIEILADCCYQDIGNEGLEAILATDTDEAVSNWRKYSAEAGDLVVVAAIDHLGLSEAANAYDRELQRREREAA